MDHVILSRAQLKTMHEMGQELVISATHPGEDMLLVSTRKKWGESNDDRRWLQRDGHWQPVPGSEDEED